MIQIPILANRIFMFLLTCSLSFTAIAMDNSMQSDPRAMTIMKKSFNLKRSRDSLSRLTFTLKEFNKPASRLVFDQVWKEYDHGPYQSKTIYFQDFPPDRKGISYMGWFPAMKSNAKTEEWLYLPELRLVRKMGGNEDTEKQAEDAFDRSEMKEADLIPRHPDMDIHHYLREEILKGIHYHVIESKPGHAMDHGAHAHHHHGGSSRYPYHRVIRWIRTDNFLPVRTDYYDLKNNLLKRQVIEWQKIGDTWEWKSVVTRNLQNRNETRLDISNLKINVGIRDRTFSKRVMKLGFSRVR